MINLNLSLYILFNAAMWPLTGKSAPCTTWFTWHLNCLPNTLKLVSKSWKRTKHCAVHSRRWTAQKFGWCRPPWLTDNLRRGREMLQSHCKHCLHCPSCAPGQIGQELANSRQECLEHCNTALPTALQCLCRHREHLHHGRATCLQTYQFSDSFNEWPRYWWRSNEPGFDWLTGFLFMVWLTVKTLQPQNFLVCLERRQKHFLP